MKKNVIKDLIVLWLSLSALVCAALNLHISLNMLENREEELELEDSTAALHFHTFEVKTLRISR